MKHVTTYILVSYIYIYMKNVTKHVIKIYQAIHSLSVRNTWNDWQTQSYTILDR